MERGNEIELHGVHRSLWSLECGRAGQRKQYKQKMKVHTFFFFEDGVFGEGQRTRGVLLQSKYIRDSAGQKIILGGGDEVIVST